MKAARFDYQRPASLEQLIEGLNRDSGYAKLMAGGQSLGPMLNLRLSQPTLIVDLKAVADLGDFKDEGEAIFIGAGVTHAMIEDGLCPDPSHGLMPQVAANIAYRAIRNRGTIGGSLAHADPAADWVSTMRLLDASYLISGSQGKRVVGSAEFMQAAFTTCLSEQDILLGVRIAKHSKSTRFGYFKFCRKVGEFAEAIGAVLIDPERGIQRMVIGATAGTPYLVPDPQAVLAGDESAIEAALLAAGCHEAYEFQTHKTALLRAIAQARAPDSAEGTSQGPEGTR